jgi:hypothetical protein
MNNNLSEIMTYITQQPLGNAPLVYSIWGITCIIKVVGFFYYCAKLFQFYPQTLFLADQVLLKEQLISNFNKKIGLKKKDRNEK